MPRRHSSNTACLLIASAGLSANLVAWACSAVGSDQSRAAALLTHAPPLVFILPALIILGISLHRRALWASLTAVVSVVVATAPLGGFALSRSHADAQGSFSVMTFNVEKWSHGASHVAALLAGSRPEVFCLQEAGNYPYVPDNTAQLREFAAMLDGFRLVQAGELTIGTRWPVVSRYVTALPIGPESRPLLEVTLLGPANESITVINAHLLYTAFFATSPTGLRDAARARLVQANAILDRIRTIRGPVVLCGDFNASPRSAALRRLKAELRDVWTEAGTGFGLTINARFPTRRIDYVLVRDLEVRRATVPRVEASDHRPVLAVFTSRPASDLP